MCSRAHGFLSASMDQWAAVGYSKRLGTQNGWAAVGHSTALKTHTHTVWHAAQLSMRHSACSVTVCRTRSAARTLRVYVCVARPSSRRTSPRTRPRSAPAHTAPSALQTPVPPHLPRPPRTAPHRPPPPPPPRPPAPPPTAPPPPCGGGLRRDRRTCTPPTRSSEDAYSDASLYGVTRRRNRHTISGGASLARTPSQVAWRCRHQLPEYPTCLPSAGGT